VSSEIPVSPGATSRCGCELNRSSLLFPVSNRKSSRPASAMQAFGQVGRLLGA
jgi:hypothetical protein